MSTRTSRFHASRRFPAQLDGSLPDAYPEFPDPYVALAFVAAQTSLRIASGIALVAQHDPIALAKTIATLDHLSGGRFTLGVGFGWNREELANHGGDFHARRAIVREHVELMRQLWTEEEAEYHGRYANLERSWSWPKPVQPSIPVLLGVQAGQRGFDADRAVGRRMDPRRESREVAGRQARRAPASLGRRRASGVRTDRVADAGGRR